MAQAGGQRWRAGALAAGAAAGSYLAVRSGRGDVLDRAARDALARPLGDRADLAIGAVTDLGSVYGLAGVAAALGATGRRRAAADVLVAGALAWAAAQAAKPALRRPRPYQVDAAERLVAVPAGSSWPSGHAAVAAATSAALAPHLPPAGRVAGGVYVAAVGMSRLYVGVHHLTDIIAGVGVGVLSADIGRRLRAVATTAWRERSGVRSADRQGQ